MAELRLFLAIDFPAELRETLVALQPRASGVRPVRVENLHLTLHFIGQGNPSALAAALEPISNLIPTFEMQLQGVGHFPARYRNSILWVGFEPNGHLQRLHAELGKLLTASGVRIDDRPYTPHATIARGERLKAADVQAFLQKHQAFSHPLSVGSVQLYSSLLGHGGPRYTIEHRLPLCGSI